MPTALGGHVNDALHAHAKPWACHPPLQVRLLRVRGRKADVWLLTNLLDRHQLSHKTAAQLYRWRWRNEGLFRTYKRMLNKVKLCGRTVAAVHREAEAAMLGLQLLLGMAAQHTPCGRQSAFVPESPRRMLLRVRGDIAALLRQLGPRQFASYQRRLAEVRSQECHRSRPKSRQPWPEKRDFRAPKAPQILLMPKPLKAKMHRMLPAA